MGGGVEERTGRTGDKVRGDWSFCLPCPLYPGQGLLAGRGKTCWESRRRAGWGRMGGAAWPGGLGITVAQKKAGMEEKEDLEPGSRGRTEGWWWQKGAQSGRGDAVRRTGGRHRTEPQMERTGRGGQRVGGGPGAHPSPEPACPGPAHLSCDTLTSLWGCQQLGPATTRSRTALGPGGAWNATPRSLPSLERNSRSRTHA